MLSSAVIASKLHLGLYEGDNRGASPRDGSGAV